MTNEVGFIVKVESPTMYLASIKKNNPVSRYDYVSIPMRERVDDSEIDVDVIGQVLWVRREPYRIGVDGYVADVLDMTPRESMVEVILAHIMVLGYRWGGRVNLPKATPPVGTPVRVASDKEVRELFAISEERSLCIGTLAIRRNIPLCIDMNGLRRHLAIIAATGGGKTWSSVVLVEELMKKGATVLVIDPHGEYVPIGRTVRKLGEEYADRVLVVKVADHHEGQLRYRINVAKVSPEVLANVAGIPRDASRIRYAIYVTHSIMRILARGNPKLASLDTMIKILGNAINGSLSINQLLRYVNVELDEKSRNALVRLLEELMQLRNYKNALISTRVYLRKLKRLGLYSHKSLPLSKLLRPGTVTILNLAGLNDEVQDHVVHHILGRIFRARINHVRKIPGPRYPYPVVVILEEAHRFVPPRSRGRTLSYEIVSRITSEGRKFGVYLVVITQRPSKVDEDILSQCNSQIILRLINQNDIYAVLGASEVLSEEMGRLIPTLDPGEGIVVGPVVPLPSVIRLRDRVLDYGGADLDLPEEWLHGYIKAEEWGRIWRRIMGTPIGVGAINEGMAMVRDTVDVALDYGVLRGNVDGVPVELRLRENNWSCPRCAVSHSPCPHVVALFIKAIMEGIVG